MHLSITFVVLAAVVLAACQEVYDAGGIWGNPDGEDGLGSGSTTSSYYVRFALH